MLDEHGCDLILRRARTHGKWLDQSVSDAQLRELYELMKWGPTSMNCSPARLVFLRTRASRERLAPALLPGNFDKTLAAPVTAIVAYDLAFYDRLPQLFPHRPGARENFALPGQENHAAATAFRNGSLQGAYFIIAARALGLDCGPLSGFDNAAVDAEFFAGTTLRSNFLCNLGHGDGTALFDRGPRLSFDEACMLL